VYSAVKNNDYIVLSVSPSNIFNMLKHIGKCEIGFDEFSRIVTPKNSDIISFVNDLVIKGRIANKYMVSLNLEEYHLNDFIWHQNKYVNNICNVFIKDTYDDVLMGGERDGFAQDCPGTRKLAETYTSAYDTTQKKVLNQNSLYIRSGGGIFSIIERNMSDFIIYLSWVKLNDALKYIKSKSPDTNIDLSSSFEIFQKTDGTVFDIVRKLKESKDTSFYMLDGKTGTKIKMSVDSNIPEVQSDVTETYYYNEFVNNMTAFRAGTVGSITTAIKSADDRLKRSMSAGIRNGLQLAATLYKQGWEQRTVNGVECFVYPKKVFVTTVADSYHKRFTVPEECRELLYVYDITVPIDSTLYGLSNSNLGVKARGFHPHRSSSSESYYTEEAHTKDLNKVCIGDLDGKPIEKITELIETLSGAYAPSMNGGMAARCIDCFFGSDLKVMSSDVKSTDVKKTLEYLAPIIKNKGVFNKAIAKLSKTKHPLSIDGDDTEPKMKSSSKSSSIFSVT
jgi:hypothetical protein